MSQNAGLREEKKVVVKGNNKNFLFATDDEEEKVPGFLGSNDFKGASQTGDDDFLEDPDLDLLNDMDGRRASGFHVQESKF